MSTNIHVCVRVCVRMCVCVCVVRERKRGKNFSLLLLDRYLPIVDSSKSYINREPSTLVGRSGRHEIGYRLDIRLTSKPSLCHHFSLYLVTSIYP